MVTWLSSLFYEARTYEKMEEGEHQWFNDIEEMPEFAYSVFPFTLPLNHPNFRSPKEAVRIGAIGDFLLDDLKLFLANTQIAVDKLSDDRSKASLLEKGPALVYPAYSTLQSIAEGLDMDSRPIIPRAEPIDMDMKPLFRHFRLRVIVNESLEFQKPMEICIALDSYHRKTIAEQPGKLVETPDGQT